MNTKAWADLVRELEAGGAGPWTCPEQGDADITVVGIKDGCRVVEWHLHCPALWGRDVCEERTGAASRDIGSELPVTDPIASPRHERSQGWVGANTCR
jgi:hypothetical protein